MRKIVVNYCNTCPATLRGYCCYHSFYNGETHWALEPCKYLNKAGRCRIYKNRFKKNKHCLDIDAAYMMGALPIGCPYIKEYDFEPSIPHKIIDKEMIKKWKLKKKIL